MAHSGIFDKSSLIPALDEAIKDMTTVDKHGRYPNGTYFFDLGTDHKDNRWAIVLGWTDGYDSTEALVDEDGLYANDTFRLAAKLAFQPKNSAMQCDYDVDWLMPYDEKTGEVNDTELSINQSTTAEEAVDYILPMWQEVEKNEKKERQNKTEQRF